MSASSIEAARAFVRVLWEDSAIRKGIQRTQAMLRTSAAAIGSVGKGLTIAGGAILAPLTAALFQFSAAGDQLEKMSGRTGASAESLSQLAYAASQSGTSLESVEKALRKLNRNVTEAADGSKTAADSLTAIGLSSEKLKGLKPDEQLKAVAQALSQISDPGERSARALDVLGKSGADLLPLMNSGAEGIENLMTRADELGLTISQDQATAAAQFGDAWDDIKSTLGGVSMQIAASLAPALTDIFKKIQPVISSVVQWVRDNSGLVRGIALLAVGMVAAGTALTVVSTVLTMLSIVIGAIASPLGIAAALAIGLGVAVVKMAGGIDNAIAMVMDAFPGLTSAMGETFTALKSLLNSGEYAAAGKLLWLSLKLAWVEGVDALNQEWMIWKQAFLDTFDSAIRIVSEKWSKLQNTLSKTVVGFMSYFDSSINVDDVNSTLDAMLQEQLDKVDSKYNKKQADRDKEFETNIGKVNQELEDARAAWSQAIVDANAIGARSASDPTAADVADNKFTDLIKDLRAGDIATKINDTVKASSEKTIGDVRSVSGAGQLLTFFNRESEVSKRQLSLLQQIAKNTSVGNGANFVNI